LIDAYTIGIRIALDDGVSAAVTQIRQKLTELNVAADTTELKLAHLIDLGKEVGHGPQADLSRPQVKQAFQRKPAVSVADPAAHLEPPQFPQPSPGTPAVAPQAKTEPEKPRDQPHASPLQLPLRPLIQTYDPNPPDPPAAPQLTIKSTIQTDAETVSAAPSTARAEVMPAQKLPDAEGRPSSAAPRVSSFNPAPLRPPAGESGTHTNAAIAPVVLPSGDQSTSEGQALRARVPEARTATAPQVPTQRPLARHEPEMSPRTDNSQRREAAHQVSGEIVLDGARLGRWISTFFAAEIGRPPAGVTGFDPRSSASWPNLLGD
jgi:hypothetical protein